MCRFRLSRLFGFVFRAFTVSWIASLRFALHGPRSVGKSTLLATLAAAHQVPVLDLDDPQTREVVLASLSLAVGQYTPLCVDETSTCRWCWMRSRRG